MKNFALVGAAGFVAPRHMKAIVATGNRLLAAVDPHDSVGILDEYAPDARFFTEIERFDRHLEKLRRQGEHERVHFVSICSPNYLHDAHVRLALRLRAHAICEKPLVINPWNLRPLEDLEREFGARVYCVLQLRLHPTIVALARRLQRFPVGSRTEVNLTYVAPRGAWYHSSWKGVESRSGGIAANIGIHFFDVLMMLFGQPDQTKVHVRSAKRMVGTLELERAHVNWYLSVDVGDLPVETVRAGGSTFRSLTIDGEQIDFSAVPDDLHTRQYEEILDGRGFGIAEARPAIELVHRIRTSSLVSPSANSHPKLRTRVERR